MNYQRIHDAIIDRARNRILQGYCETHHVIPRCLGGTDDKMNLVNLTAREHFIVHKLLCEIYPNDAKLFFAYRMMAIVKSPGQERNYEISSREFERIRKNFSELIRVVNQRPNTEEHNKKISVALLGKPKAKTAIEKMRKSLTGKKHSADHIEKNRQAQTGRIHSAETKQKMRISKLGELNPNYNNPNWNSGMIMIKTETCNFCGELYSKSGIKNHENSCKNKKKII